MDTSGNEYSLQFTHAMSIVKEINTKIKKK